jgi:hypothetical protein
MTTQIIPESATEDRSVELNSLELHHVYPGTLLTPVPEIDNDIDLSIISEAENILHPYLTVLPLVLTIHFTCGT